MGNNGLALAAGLLNGIGQGMQTAQDRALKQEYQKVMMDQHKLQGKMLEAKMKEMDLKSSIQPQLISFLSGLDAGGAPGTGAPNIAPAATPEGFTANPVPSDMGSGNRMQDALRFFLTQGYQPHQAAGIVGNLMHESGLNPAIPGDNGASLGLAQWNGPRRQALADFAATQGKSPTDFNTQLGFVNHELSGPESAAGNALRQARTLPEATQTFSQMYERPGIPAMNSRMAAASQAYNALPQMLAAEQTRQQINSPKSPSDRLSITKMPIGKRVALDLMFKQMFDLDTKFRENKTTIKTKEDGGYDVFDPDGNLIKTIPGPGKTQLIPYTTGTGATGVQPVSVFPGGRMEMGGAGLPTAPAPVEWKPVKKPGGGTEMTAVPKVPQLGMSYQSEPDTKEMTKGIPTSIDEKITTVYDPMVRQLDYLKSNYVGPKGTDKYNVFGVSNQMKFSGAESPWLRSAMEGAGMNVSPELIDFHKTMKRLENFEVHNFGGSNLTYQELQRALAQIPRTNNPKDFSVAVDAAKRAYDAYKQSIYDYYSKTEGERQKEVLQPKPSLNAFKNQRMRYNPQTNSLEPVQ